MKFWQELRRRRVFRMAGLYIVGAWLLIQVADISFPAWGVPDTALRFLFIAAAACFPVALIFSWRYDVTSHGVVRTEAADVSETVDLKLKRADYVILTALLAVGLAILLGSANKIRIEIDAGPTISLTAGWREDSIAVLPFANLDINPETGFFSDGITEEILHRLSSLGALHVLASNSSFAFRDSEDSPSKIREKLGVRYLLQGSIRRDDDVVRVTARLIDEGGFQIWSESFERRLEGIFAIQTDIASTVASEIINEIVPLQAMPAGRTTTNMEAYNEYLAGRALLDARTVSWREQAAAYFRRAIELDLGFAPPYAALAITITVNSGPGPQWEEGRQLVEKALELDSDLAEAHAALGLILMAERRLYRSSLSLRKALNLDPSLGFAYNILSVALYQMGRPDESNAVERKGLAVDPLNPPLIVNAAGNESSAGNFERAEQLLLRLVNLPQPPPLALRQLASLYEQWGRFADALSIAKQNARLTASPDNTEALNALVWGYANLGMTEEADYWKDLLQEHVQDDLANLDLTYNVLRTRDADSELGVQLQQLVNLTEFRVGEHSSWTLAQFGLVNIHMGDFERGIEQLEYGLRLFQAGPGRTEPAGKIDVSAIRGNQDDIVWVIHQLVFAYQRIGRNEDADRMLQQLTDEFGMEDYPLHHALMGDTARAFEMLQSTMQSGRAKWSF
jgi:TolB-like protein/Tfp pilus assembly protein PilF